MDPPDWRALSRRVAESLWEKGALAVVSVYAETFLKGEGIVFDQSDPELEQNFEKLCDRVTKDIARRAQGATDRGVVPRLVPSPIASGVVLPGPIPRGQPQDFLRLRPLVQECLSALDWDVFEGLAALVLELEGLSNCGRMRGSQEEGIDLFGKVHFGERLLGPLWTDLHVRLVGQAKLGPIEQPMVRLLEQDLRSFANRSGRAYQNAPLDFRDLETPVLGFMFSAGHVTEDAREWGRRHGIPVKDGEQVAEIVLRSDIARRAWIEVTSDGSRFKCEDFSEYLARRFPPTRPQARIRD